MSAPLMILVVLTFYQGKFLHEQRSEPIEEAQCLREQKQLQAVKLLPPYRFKAACVPSRR